MSCMISTCKVAPITGSLLKKHGPLNFKGVRINKRQFGSFRGYRILQHNSYQNDLSWTEMLDENLLQQYQNISVIMARVNKLQKYFTVGEGGQNQKPKPASYILTSHQITGNINDEILEQLAKIQEECLSILNSSLFQMNIRDLKQLQMHSKQICELIEELQNQKNCVSNIQDRLYFELKPPDYLEQNRYKEIFYQAWIKNMQLTWQQEEVSIQVTLGTASIDLPEYIVDLGRSWFFDLLSFVDDDIFYDEDDNEKSYEQVEHELAVQILHTWKDSQIQGTFIKYNPNHHNARIVFNKYSWQQLYKIEHNEQNISTEQYPWWNINKAIQYQYFVQNHPVYVAISPHQLDEIKNQQTDTNAATEEKEKTKEIIQEESLEQNNHEDQKSKRENFQEGNLSQNQFPPKQQPLESYIDGIISCIGSLEKQLNSLKSIDTNFDDFLEDLSQMKRSSIEIQNSELAKINFQEVSGARDRLKTCPQTINSFKQQIGYYKYQYIQLEAVLDNQQKFWSKRYGGYPAIAKQSDFKYEGYNLDMDEHFQVWIKDMKFNSDQDLEVIFGVASLDFAECTIVLSKETIDAFDANCDYCKQDEFLQELFLSWQQYSSDENQYRGLNRSFSRQLQWRHVQKHGFNPQWAELQILENGKYDVRLKRLSQCIQSYLRFLHPIYLAKSVVARNATTTNK